MAEATGLREEVRRAAVWLVILRVVSRSLGMVGLVLVARWVGPSEVGVFAAGMLVISSLETVSSPGLEAALIQRKVFTNKSADVVWTLQIVKGVLVAALLFTTSPWVAELLSEPGAVPVLRILAVVPLLSGAKNSFLVLLRRELDFRTEAWVQIVPAILGFATSVVWAVNSPTSMSLVAGTVVKSTTTTIASFVVMEDHPRVSFDFAESRSLFGFGRWVWASGALVFLITQGDDLVVGALLGAAALGIYQVAYRLSTAAIVETVQVVNTLSFPLLSRLQDTPDRFVPMFIRGFSVSAAVIVPFAVAVGVAAGPLVTFLLGPSWNEAITVAQVLVVWGVVRGLGAVTSPALQALGRPDAIAKYQFAMFVLIALAIYPAIVAWGTVGAAVAVTIPMVLIHPLRYPLIAVILGVPVRDILAPLLSPVAAGLAMAGVMLATASYADSVRLVVLGELALALTAGFLVYASTLWLFDRLRGGTLLEAARLLLRRAT